MNRNDAYWVLNGLKAIGPISLNRLLDAFGRDPVAVLSAGESALRSVHGITKNAVDSILRWNQHFDLKKEKLIAAKRSVAFIDRESDRYPAPLKEIHDPPIGIYAMGVYGFSANCVAIVGSRRTTMYGQSVARGISRELSQSGICVVSGLARGIDTYAHKGALESGKGLTVAVMGCGIDIIYPPENIDLYREIGDRCAVLSEFPFGRRADKQTFPMRNRLVSGLSKAVVVIESDLRGGSMITAKFAGEQGRLVCAVPGRIDQRTSRGCNQLIRDGALLLSSVDDLLNELAYECQLPQLERLGGRERGVDIEILNADESSVLKLFSGGEVLDADRIGRKVDRPASEVSSALMLLELKGYIAKRLDGSFEAVSTFR